MENPELSTLGRRKFIADTIKTSVGTAIVVGFTTIVPSSVFGKNAPSNRINVASIGCGRISTSHDMTAIARYAGARIIAVCDLDKNRADAGPAAVKANYERSSINCRYCFENRLKIKSGRIASARKNTQYLNKIKQKY